MSGFGERAPAKGAGDARASLEALAESVLWNHLERLEEMQTHTPSRLVTADGARTAEALAATVAHLRAALSSGANQKDRDVR